MFNSLGQLDRGSDGNPYNLDFPQFELIFLMMARFKDVIEPWQKAREQRMKVIAGRTPIKRAAMGNEIEDPEKQAKFLEEEQRQMDEVIFIPRFPKKKLELALDKNKYSPRLLIDLQGLWVEPAFDKFEIEEDDSEVVDPHPHMQAAE
jgi:hypothetical protein